MRDLRRFRDAWLQRCAEERGDGCPSQSDIALDGEDDHPKRDLNFDGCVTGESSGCDAPERSFARLDFNGDGAIEPAKQAFVVWKRDGEPARDPSESEQMSDLDVLASVWTGGGDEAWGKSDLKRLMRSADVEVRADSIFADGATKVKLSLREKGGAAVGPGRTLRPNTSAIMTVPLDSPPRVRARGRGLDRRRRGVDDLHAVHAALRRGQARAGVPRARAHGRPRARSRDGWSEMVVTLKLPKCLGRPEVADKDVTFEVDSGAGGSTITARDDVTDDDGEAEAEFIPGTEGGTATVTATIAIADGAEPVEKTLEIEVEPLIQVRYRWRQFIEKWEEHRHHALAAAEPSDARLHHRGSSPTASTTCSSRCEPVADGVERTERLSSAARLDGHRASVRRAASSNMSWTRCRSPTTSRRPAGPIDSRVGRVTDPDAYTDHAVAGPTQGAARRHPPAAGMQSVADLPYHYSLSGATGGRSTRRAVRRARALPPPAPATGSRSAATGHRSSSRDGEELKQFQSCGGWTTTFRSGYPPTRRPTSRVAWTRPQAVYEPGDRPMAAGPGQLEMPRVRRQRRLRRAPPPEPELPDCTRTTRPTPTSSSARADEEPKEGREVIFEDRSTDPEDDIETLDWDFGDGTTDSGRGR